MAIISKRKKAYSVVYKRDEKTIEEIYYDRKLAQKRKEQIEDEQYNLTFCKDTPILEYLYLFMNIEGRHIWAVNTHSFYISVINNYLSKVLKDYVLDDINESMIDDVFERLKDVKSIECSTKTTPYTSPSIQRKAKILLATAFERLVEEGYLAKNPVINIEIESVEKARKKFNWELHHIEKIFKNCKNQRMFVLLHLLFGTNIKINEMLCITLDDVHVDDALFVKDECYITINKIVNRINLNSLSMIDESDIIDKVINKRQTIANTQLTVYKKDEYKEHISKPLASILKDFLREKKTLNHIYLLCNYKGELMDRRVLNKQLKSYMKEMDLPYLPMTDLRILSNQLYDNQQTNREYYYSHLAEDLHLPKEKEVIKTNINEEIKAELPNTDQELINRFVNALNEDKELKVELMHRLKEFI